jgi:hypothetical protein
MRCRRHADIVGFGQAGVYVSLATDNGHFASPTFELAAFAPDAGGWSSDNLYKRELADVNGDGRDDIVGFGQAGPTEVRHVIWNTGCPNTKTRWTFMQS